MARTRYIRTRLLPGAKLLARWLFAAFLVFGTYNPTGRSYYHWMHDGDATAIWKLIGSGFLVVAYGVAIPVTWRALGFGGLALTTSLATSLAWLLIEAGWVSLAAADATTWISLAVLAFVLGVGLCWMQIARGFDGQLRTRDLNR